MGRAPTGRPTSFDIAYLAGVSQPTVSRALRDDKSVSEATRERIKQIARDLNYTVDKNASSLRSQRSNTIALLFFEDPTPDESMINPFFLAMLGSITRACANRGLDLLISFQRMEDDWHVQYQDSHRADGLILLGYGDFTLYRERLEQLERQGTKFARWGSVSKDMGGTTANDRAARPVSGWRAHTCWPRDTSGLPSSAMPTNTIPNSKAAMPGSAPQCAKRGLRPIRPCSSTPSPPRKQAMPPRAH